MTTQRSARAKGRGFEQKITNLLKSYFDLTDDDLRPAPASINGQDIQRMSEIARVRLPFAIETKKVEKVNIWSALEQAKKNADKNSAPVVIFSRNHTKSYIVFELDVFLYIWKMVLPFFNIHNFIEFLREYNDTH